MRNKNSLTLLLFLSGILFLALYLLLAFHNRLPYEDYYFLVLSKKKGSVNAMLDVYVNYSARWSAHTLGFYFSAFYKWKYFLFVFNIITLGAFLLSLFLLLKKILNDLFNFRITFPALCAYAILFTICFFFSSYDIGEVWFWYMVNWMYIWSLIAGNFLLLILLTGKFKANLILPIILLSAYIAGAAESYAAVWIMLLASSLIIKRKNIFPRISINLNTKTLLTALISLSLLYLFALFAPGTAARKDMLTDASFSAHILMCVKAYGIVFIKKLPFILPQLLLFSLPWILLGKEFESNEKTEMKKLFPLFIKSILFIGILFFLLILPASWVLYDPPPDRALSQVSLLLCAYTAFVFFYLGYKCNISKKKSEVIALAALVTGIFFIAFHLSEQHSIVVNFSREYDSRLEQIKQESSKGRTQTLWLEDLPPSGMLYSDVLTTFPNAKKSFEDLYCPGFEVAIKNTTKNKK